MSSSCRNKRIHRQEAKRAKGEAGTTGGTSKQLQHSPTTDIFHKLDVDKHGKTRNEESHCHKMMHKDAKEIEPELLGVGARTGIYRYRYGYGHILH
jgi:hypothetical protein